MKTISSSWFEKSSLKKQRFRELYGRKPTREEIKLLRKNRIDLNYGDLYTSRQELQTPHQNSVYRELDDHRINRRSR